MTNSRDFVTHYREPQTVHLQRADRREVNRLIQSNDARFLSPPNRPEAELAAQNFGTTVSELLEDPGYQKRIQAIGNGFLPANLKSRRKGSWDRQAMERWLVKAAAADSIDARAFALRDLFQEMVDLRDHRNMSRHTEVFAEEAAKRILMRMGADILPLKNHGSGTLDIVAVLNGKLIVIESKGGASNLQWAYAQDDRGDWHWVQQGSLVYLRYKLREHTEILAILKTYKNGKYEYLAHKLEHGKAVIEYSKVHAAYGPGEIGNRGVGSVAFTRFDLGMEPAGLVAAPPPGSRARPGRKGNPSFPEPVRTAFEQQRKKIPVTGPSPSWTIDRRTGGASRALTIAAGASVTGLSAVGLSVATAGTATAQSGSLAPPIDSATAFTGMSVSGSAAGSFGDLLLSTLKATLAEFSRMATSFTSYVQNGLNELVMVVGGAVSAVSGFVSDVIDSAGVQAVIDKVSDDWAFAQELLNIAMLFSPVGTVAAAISAAVPIIQLIVEHWDQIRAAFDWVLKNVLTPVAEFFMTAFKVYIAPYRLAFDAVMAGFNGMGGVVGSAVGAVRSTVVGIVKAIGQIFQRLEINIGFPVNKSFGLKSVGDAMVAWASERLADGGLVGGQRGPAPHRAAGIEVMAVIDPSVLRAAQAEERKIGYAYRLPFLHDGALPRTDNGTGPRTFDVRVADVDAAFAQIRFLQAVQDARFSAVGV